MKDPITHEANACCHVRPTAMREAAAFHPAVPKAVDPQYRGKLYQVQVRSSGGVGSKSLFDHFALPTVRCSPPSGVVLRASRNASLERNGAAIDEAVGKGMSTLVFQTATND